MFWSWRSSFNKTKMTRQKFDLISGPQDPRLLQELIEAVAKQSVDTVLIYVRQLPFMRKVLLRNPQQTGWDLNRVFRKQGALIQRRGDVANSACIQCQANRGLFTQCVLLDKFMGGGCASCFLSRYKNGRAATCSLATQSKSAWPLV